MDKKLVLFLILSCFISQGSFCGYDRPLNENEIRELEILDMEEKQKELAQYLTTISSNELLETYTVQELVSGINNITDTRDEKWNIIPYLSKILTVFQKIETHPDFKTLPDIAPSFKHIFIDCDYSNEQWKLLTQANIVDHNTVKIPLSNPDKNNNLKNSGEIKIEGIKTTSLLKKHKTLLSIVTLLGLAAIFFLHKKNLISIHFLWQRNTEKG